MRAFGGTVRALAGQTPRHSWHLMQILALTLFALLAVLAAPALAWDDDDDSGGGSMNKIQGHCPGTIYKSTRLIGDIIAQPLDPDPCISFARDNIRLDMDGYFINVSRPLGSPAIRAIATNGFNNAQIEGNGGFILTAYPNPPNTDPTSATTCMDDPPFASPCAIHVKGGAHARVRDVFIRNTLSGATFGPATPEMISHGVSQNVVVNGVPVCPDTNGRGGAGIFLQNAYKAKLHDNWVECFNFGIFVTVSDGGDTTDGGFISHNLVKDNTRPASNTPFPPPSGDNATSSGIVLTNSRGWMVSRNVATGNGSVPNSPGDSNIVVNGISTKNRFEQNKTDNNLGPGVTVATGAVSNLFMRNHVTWNSGGLPNTMGGYDLGDTNVLGANAYKKNVCRYSMFTGVPATECSPTVN